jgi:hypothetical protein
LQPVENPMLVGRRLFFLFCPESAKGEKNQRQKKACWVRLSAYFVGATSDQIVWWTRRA